MGQNFFDDLAVNDIASIQIASSDGTVLLKKGADLWVVEDRYGYPADFSKITDLVKKLKDAKVGRSFNATDEVLARLAMYPPEKTDVPENQRGTRVVFKNGQDQTLADVMMGPAEGRTEVYYLKHTAKPTICLIDKNFRFLEKKPAEWLVKEIINLEEKDIARIVCFPARSQTAAYTIERPEKGKDASITAVPEGKKVEKYKIDQMLGILSALKIEDVADPGQKLADSKFSEQPRFEYHLFNGTVYTISPGTTIKEGSDHHYLKATVAYFPPAESKSDTAKEAEKTAETVQKQNHQLSAWTYVVSKWVYNSFLTRPEDFFEKEEKK